MELILNIGSDLQRFFGLASAGTVGNADEIGFQKCQFIQNGKRIGKIILLLRGEYFKRKSGFLFIKNVLDHVLPHFCCYEPVPFPAAVRIGWL